MEVTARRHNTDDIIATVLAVEPMKFIYRGRSVIMFYLFIAVIIIHEYHCKSKKVKKANLYSILYISSLSLKRSDMARM